MSGRYDIIINGGGIVGFTLLNLLKKSRIFCNCKILLVEQAEKPKRLDLNDVIEKKNQYSNRVSSINPSSRQVFEHLGIWKDLSKFAKSIKRIRVWNYDYKKSINFDQLDINPEHNIHESMFDVVENNRILTALVKNLENNNHGDSILWNHSLDSMVSKHDSKLETLNTVNNKTNDTASFKGSLIVGCDGFQSKVRNLAKIAYNEVDLKKSALVGTIKIAQAHNNPNNNIAFQRFSVQQDTVAAILPLSDTHSSFVISAPNDYCDELNSTQDDEFVDKFNALLTTIEKPDSLVNTIDTIATNTLCSLIKTPTSSEFDDPPRVESLVPNSRATFKLHQGKSLTMVSNQRAAPVVLVGDSAHRIHPLAGQGLNLGIQDAQALLDELETAVNLGESLWDPENPLMPVKVRFGLSLYSQKRLKYVSIMSFGIKQSPSLFRIAGPNLLSLTDHIYPFKKFLVKFANGPNSSR